MTDFSRLHLQVPNASPCCSAGNERDDYPRLLLTLANGEVFDCVRSARRAVRKNGHGGASLARLLPSARGDTIG